MPNALEGLGIFVAGLLGIIAATAACIKVVDCFDRRQARAAATALANRQAAAMAASLEAGLPPLVLVCDWEARVIGQGDPVVEETAEAAAQPPIDVAAVEVELVVLETEI